MKTYDRNKPLISIHIPKNGGVSFGQVLGQWFGKDLYFHYYDEIKNKFPERHRLLPGVCIHGHFNKKRNFGIQDYYPEADQFITFLRDPFEILVSRYFFVKKRYAEGRSFLAGNPLQLSKDLDEYLKMEITKKDYHPNILDYMPTEVTMSNFKEVINEYFVYIGIIEDYQFSIDRLAGKFNYPSLPVGHLNKSERFGSYSSEYKKKFIESHPVEYAFYRYVFNNYKKY